MTVSPAASIAARGVPIRLYDGTEVRLRYSMLSLELMERRFGNLAAIQRVVQDAVDALQAVSKAATAAGRETMTDRERELVATNSRADVFTQITALLLPGLIDERATDPRDPAAAPQFLEGPDGEQLAKRVLDPALLRDYVNAFRRAFVEAFPDEQPQAGGATDPQLPPLAAQPGPVLRSFVQESMTGSPGPIGTTSPVGALGVPMPSSGA